MKRTLPSENPPLVTNDSSYRIATSIEPHGCSIPFYYRTSAVLANR
ncbi:hypothetical protein Ngar_c09150 [Candidatus Nitrososphaera gargensis Ga9.2]|uniref:Uncharacterized protein n=1 Tax=Nitrososphaera gargensis (strain Ga9.2) TaxID=1237085 RepID=K0IIH0_NITGG|nr:hypothetical protein Ngar_c09150 [Candidatus Nitrososphaera gargensis Ga9.2]